MPGAPMKAPHILGAFVPNGRAITEWDGGEERYSLQPGASSSHDEEIYVHRNRVVWSIGGQVAPHPRPL